MYSRTQYSYSCYTPLFGTVLSILVFRVCGLSVATVGVRLFVCGIAAMGSMHFRLESP